jgi:V8-like Glu-specific endopeptidase
MMLATRALIGAFAVLPIVVVAAMGPTPPFGAKYSQLVAPEIDAAVKTTDAVGRRIVDDRVGPYAAIGKFEGTMACTAAIVVDPRIILTAGHCVMERDGSIRKSNLSFRLGYQSGNDLGQFEATLWAVGSKQSFKQQSVHEAAQDWALLVLDRAPAGVRPFLLSHESFEFLKSHERQLLMPGYSSDIGGAEVLSVDPTCSIRNLVWDVLIHDCTAWSGSSGAPLLIRDGQWYAVVGIHTGSMFASDGNGRVAKFVGYRAIGSWMFTESSLTLSRHLAVENAQAGNPHTY